MTPGRRLTASGRVQLKAESTLRRSAAASLTAVLMMPETFARLKHLIATRTCVRSHVGVGPFMCADRREVLEAFTTQSTRLVELSRTVLEQHVLLEVVALFEADQTDETNVRTLLRVCTHVIAEVRVLCEGLTTRRTRPLVCH